MSTELIIWICILTLSLTIGTIQIFALCGFYSIQHLVIIGKRYPKLVMIEAIAVIFLCIIVIPFWYNILLDAVQFNGFEGLHLIGWITLAPTNHIIANIEACRCWLMSYNLHYLHSSKNKQWKSEIDHNFADKNWYLLNKKKYGNRNYVISRVAIYYIIAACVSTSCFLCFHDRLHISEIVDVSFFSVPVTITIITYLKCPKHNESNDNFYFHYEIKAITLIYISGFILYVTSTVFGYLQFHLLHTMFLLAITVYGVISPSLVSTLWIPRKILLDATWKRDHARHSAKINRCIVVMNAINTDTQSEEDTSSKRLRNMFVDEEKFESFVHWMYREFSNETILCFIELIQYKCYMIDIVEKQSGERIECGFTLYPNVPQSTIIYSMFTDDEERIKYRKMAHELYKKYMQVDAHFEVNISAIMRQKYQLLDEKEWNLEAKELVGVFDDVVHEMVVFISSSFNRWEGCNI